MTGHIKITAATRDGHRGLNVETDLQNVSFMDRMQVLDSLCRSLKISLTELKLFVSMKSEGILDKAVTVKTVKDECVKEPGADLLDQLLHVMLGGDDSEG